MKKVMLVDDMDIFNFIMKKLIDNVDPIHEVYDFINPEEALGKLQEINPDVIFLDLNMPVMDGWDFLLEMQKQDLNQKVFVLTSSTSELDRRRSLDFKNVVNFLIKPISEEEISFILQTA